MLYKKWRFTLFSCLLSVQLFAQAARDTVPLKIPKRAHVIYGGIFGNGLVLSMNYDTRFSKSQKGLGMHAGIGYLTFLLGGGIVTFPIGINHLSGKAPNYLELGLCYTYAKRTGFYSADEVSDTEGSILMPGIGYRYQRAKTGFFFRINYSPLINLQDGGAVWPVWGGIGLGCKF